MEESQSKEEGERSSGETPLDAVDHGRLARLVTATPATIVNEEQPLRSVQVSTGSMPRAMPSPAAYQQSARASAVEAAAHRPSLAPPKKSSSSALVIIAVAGLLLLTGAAGIYLLLSTRSDKPKTITTTPDVPAPVKADMIAISGGTFQMGRADGEEQEGPPHNVTVAAFFIDRTEVTNAEYAQFVQETKHPAPKHFSDNRPIKGQGQWPVTNVSVEDANAFAAWRSKRDGVTYRLPTEEEWEFAARDGSQGTIFPWGSSWVDGKANVNSTSLNPVGASPDDKTRAGVVDMIGNAYEWTSSRASYYPGSKGQVKPDNKDWFIVRGGAYITDSSRKQISATYRDWIPSSLQNQGLGFRLVRAQ